MGFTDAIRTVLKEKYATFQGRAMRSEYWWFVLFYLVVGVVLAGLLALTTNGFQDFEFGTLNIVDYFIMAVGVLFALAVIIPMFALTVRRFHDINLSGWWYLVAIVVGFVPVIGFIASIAVFVVTLIPGTRGENKFGPDPKNPAVSADTFA